MAYIECKKCKATISNLEDKCPFCGEEIIKKDIFESGNTIDFKYQNEPIYKAAKLNFYSTFGLIVSIMMDVASILLLISLNYIVGYILMGLGVLLTTLFIICLIKSKKMEKKANLDDLNN